jgi:hypothetical protein
MKEIDKNETVERYYQCLCAFLGLDESSIWCGVPVRLYTSCPLALHRAMCRRETQPRHCLSYRSANLHVQCEVELRQAAKARL